MIGDPRIGGEAGSLPLQPTPLIGRTRELLLVRQLVQREDVRLVTLSGTAGVGKTRLALAAAASLRPEFPDGTYFIDLSPISDPILVATTIAHRIGLAELGALDAVEGMLARLRDLTILLVLDNFEQVIPAAPLLAELLGACAGLKILVTSRISLGLRWEHEFPVPPLPLPDLQHLPPLDVLAEAPPIALFTSRAQAVNPRFCLTPDNACTVAAICTRLDGLPLAIELAAARSKILTPPAMLARLGRRLDLLRSSSPDQPLRHRTLRGAISWSYEALTPEQKTVFRRLAVFVGNIPGSDAQRIVWDAATANTGDVLDHFSALVDQSLLHLESPPDGVSEPEPRFRMLETIHEFATECLERAGEAAEVQQRHASYYLSLAVAAEPELTGPIQASWLDRLEREHDNLRAVLRRSIDSGNRETGLQIAAGIWRFWMIRGYVGEGMRWLEALLAADGPVSAGVQGRALLGMANLTWDEGNSGRAGEFARRALTLLEGCADEAGTARCLNIIGNVSRDLGDLAAATAAYERSLALREKLGDRGGISQSLNNLGNAVRDQGDYPRAIALYERSLALRRQQSDHLSMAESLNDLGRVLRLAGEFDQALARQRECLPIFQRLRDRRGAALTLCEMAALAYDRDNSAVASRLASEATLLFREAGEHWGVALALLILGRCAVRDRQAIRAARLLGAAVRLLDGLDLGVPVIEQDYLAQSLEACGRLLGPDTFATAWAAGRALSVAEAIEEAQPSSAGGAAMGESAAGAVPPSAMSPRPADDSGQSADASGRLDPPSLPPGSPTPPLLACSSPGPLTPRERDVAACLARGRTTRQIATDLTITEGTVRLHLAHIFAKLGFHSRTELAAWAVRQGLDAGGTD